MERRETIMTDRKEMTDEERDVKADETIRALGAALESLRSPPEVALYALLQFAIAIARHPGCPADVRELTAAFVARELAKSDDMPADQVH
jgi:hypothetical protein